MTRNRISLMRNQEKSKRYWIVQIWKMWSTGRRCWVVVLRRGRSQWYECIHSKEFDATCEMYNFVVKLAALELYVFELMHKTHFIVPKAYLGFLQLKVAKCCQNELHLRLCDGAWYMYVFFQNAFQCGLFPNLF